MNSITTSNPEQAAEFVFEKILEKYQKNHQVILALSGDLGAGKTTLTQNLCRLLNVQDIVTSPTFSILNIYEGTIDDEICDVYHFDWYRLMNEEELGVINLNKIFSRNGIFFIEWPEQLPDALKNYEHLFLHIKAAGDEREYTFK